MASDIKVSKVTVKQSAVQSVNSKQQRIGDVGDIEREITKTKVDRISLRENAIFFEGRHYG